MRYFKVLFLIGLFLIWGNLSARDLDLAEAYRLAQDHSYRLKQMNSQQESARAGLGAAQSGRWPTFSASAVSFYNSKVATLDINIPPNFHLERAFGSKETYQTDLKISLPLFTGGKISGAIANARASLDYQNALTELEGDRLYLQIRSQYLGLYQAGEYVKVAQASLKRTVVIKQDIDNMYAAGTADSTDLLEAALAVSKAEIKLKEAQTARRQVEIDLLTALGLDVTEQINLSEQLAVPEVLSADLTLAENKPELKAGQASIAMTSSYINLERADLWPVLSVYGGYSYGKPNLDRFNNTWNDYFTVGANLIWDINLGGGDLKDVKAARYKKRSANFEYDRLKEDLAKNLSLTREQLKLSFEKYLNARREYEITSNNYRLSKARHSAGALATNRLVEIETNLTAVESARVAALVEYYSTLGQYYFQAGSPKLKEGKL